VVALGIANFHADKSQSAPKRVWTTFANPAFCRKVFGLRLLSCATSQPVRVNQPRAGEVWRALVWGPVHDELRPGRPRPISDERVAQLVRKTLETKPKGDTHWSIRQIAAETRVSKSTVHRIWQAFGLEPHRQKHFKLSTDPFFVEKVRDIVGLYLDPTENAVVLSWMKRARFRRWNVGSRCCRWDLAKSRA
jgi:Homeodomain-like domain